MQLFDYLLFSISYSDSAALREFTTSSEF